jgi:uncharacterized protein (DUF58 family)
MRSLAQSASGSAWRDMRALARQQLAKTDRAAWRRFFFALIALGLSLFLALFATALREDGHYELAAAGAVVSLILAGIVAVKVVPYLARRTALERWFGKVEYEFTREGAVYLAIIAVISVAALNTGNNLLFIILASLLAGILVSGIFSKIVLEGLELEMSLPEHIFAGRPVIARLTLSNAKWVFPSFSVTVSVREPDRKKKTAVPVASRPILDDAVYVPYIPHRASVTQRVELLFPRRGRYAQDGLRVGTKFPFGFLRKAHEVLNRKEILVLPSVERSERFNEILPLIGAELESFFKGRGQDLYAIRDYQETDPARHVDWKATAKAQQLKVREFSREDDRRLAIVFDNRLPEQSEAAVRQFEKGVALCACLAWHFSEIGAHMQFLTFAYETEMAPASDLVFPVLEKLAMIEPIAVRPSQEALSLEPPEDGTEVFRVVLTFNGKFATESSESSHVILMDSL